MNFILAFLLLFGMAVVWYWLWRLVVALGNWWIDKRKWLPTLRR